MTKKYVAFMKPKNVLLLNLIILAIVVVIETYELVVPFFELVNRADALVVKTGHKNKLCVYNFFKHDCKSVLNGFETNVLFDPIDLD